MDNPEKLATYATQDEEDMNNKYATPYVLDPTIRKETQITLKVSNVSIDGKTFTSGTCEHPLGGVILSVHSSRQVDAGIGCWWSQINYYKFGIC
jgi:hypothetical protein